MIDLRKDPNDDDAQTLARDLLGQDARICRFLTGSQHFVFEASAPGHEPVVLRLTRGSERHLAAAAIGWSERLRPLGLPLPRVLAADLDGKNFAWVMLERVPGCDLGNVFESLSQTQLGALATELVAHQRRLDDLPDGNGYGFVLGELGPFPETDWVGVLHSELRRSRKRIREVGAVREHLVDIVESAATATQELDVPSRPFLHDITTRNVIVCDGALSGIVDVDSLCYGDALYLVGLIGAILTAYGWDDHYFDAWLRECGTDAMGRARVHLYRRIHAVGLLSEIGHCFNRNSPVPSGGPLQTRLEAFLEGDKFRYYR